MDFPVDPDIADMMKKESKMAMSHRHREVISSKEALKLGQEARAIIFVSISF